ncbi:hypothetical protein PFISCL1PPCAC_3376, partial [Pristionchus fissidentatus]
LCAAHREENGRHKHLVGQKLRPENDSRSECFGDRHDHSLHVSRAERRRQREEVFDFSAEYRTDRSFG